MSDIDYSMVKSGDKVELEQENGDRAYITVYTVTDGVIYSRSGQCFNGWMLRGHEPKKVELPTAPGLYLDNDGEPWRLSNHGLWRYLLEEECDFDVYPENYAPFTRLVPVAEVIDQVRELLTDSHDVCIADGCSIAGDLDVIACQYGVQS